MEEKHGSISLYVSTIGVLSALMAVLAWASITVPPPVQSIDASSVLIFAVSILYGPELGMIITSIGQFIGKGFYLSSLAAPAIFIPGIVAVRGPEAAIVGYIGRTNRLSQNIREPLAMVIGVLWETGAFMVADYLLFGIAGAIGVIWTIVDLVWVPLGAAAIYYARISFKAQYLDESIGLTEVKPRRGFLVTGIIFILICWGLIILSAITGWALTPLIPPSP